LRHTIQVVVGGVLFLAASCLGYGGFEATSTFSDVEGLNHKLDSLNQAMNGTGRFTYRSPVWWLGGHGGDFVGPVTLGGSGALSIWHHCQVDSLESRLFAVRANFEVGFPYSPNEWISVRPCLELGGNGMVVYAQTLDADSKMWFAAWNVGAAPGIELMGSLPTSSESSIGLFVKGSYFIPVSGPSWFGDKDPPAFSLRGFALQVGLRFGRTASTAAGDGLEY